MNSSYCPYCGENSFVDLHQNINIKNGFNYLRNIKSSKEFKSWLGKTELVKCKECSTVYPYPKIDRSLIERIYTNDKSSHDMGWNAIERSQISNIKEHKVFNFINNLVSNEINMLEKNNLNGSLNIAEFGCPFSGFAMSDYWSRGEYINFNNRDNPGSINGKLYIYFLNLLNFFMKFNLKIRNKKTKKLIKNKKKIIKTFIVEYSNVFWLGNCVRYGKSCINLANEFIFDKVSSIRNAKERKSPFDLLIVSNSIDHYINGFEIIKELSELSKNLLIFNHSDNRFSAQHIYGINYSTMEWTGKQLKNIYKNSNYKVISCTINKNNYYGLIVRDLNK